jgi:hypothetical protein
MLWLGTLCNCDHKSLMQKRPLVCVDWQDAPGTTLCFCYTVQNLLMFMVVGNWLIFSISLTNLFFCCCVYCIRKVMRCSNYWTGVTSRAQYFTTYSTHCSSACLCYISTGGFSSFAWLLSKLKPEAESQMTSALVPMSLLTQLLVIHVCCNKLQIVPSWLVLEQFTLHWHDFDPFVHTTVSDDDDSDKEDWDKTGQEDPLQVSTTSLATPSPHTNTFVQESTLYILFRKMDWASVVKDPPFWAEVTWA